MNSSDQQPKFPSWVFIVTDVALVAIAALIAWKADRRLTTPEMLTVVGCVGVGVLVGLVPLIVRLEREKNEVLDERQRALEALARTVSSSAEQISIAAGGLHEIADVAQKNLKQAEQLPHKLHEKIAEFQAQLATAEDTEKEELERELLALRTTESERLETISQRVAKSSAEWAKLEAATQQHLTAANEAVGKLAMGTANAIGKAQAAAEQALAQARIEAARSLGETSAQGARAVESAKAAALAEIDAKLAAAASVVVERVVGELQTKLSAALRDLEERRPHVGTVSMPASEPEHISGTSVAAAAPVNHAPAPDAMTPPQAEAAAPAPAVTPKRPRKPRREEPAPGDHASAQPEQPSPAPAEVTLPAADAAASAAPAHVDEPAPVPAEKIAEIAPVAPSTSEPFSSRITATPAETSDQTPEPQSHGVSAPAAEESAPVPAAPEPIMAAPAPRKRAPRKVEPNHDGGLELGLDLPSETPELVGVSVLSSDGATRLLVTAYIGIGNRLFIRGEGPGLSWEKGVPLQFVSIGKWRWESNDASAAIRFKLYKNDEQECAALGAQTLEPAHQQEVTATF